MSAHHDAMLLHLRCHLEALVSERAAMTVANYTRADQGLSPAYDEDAFHANAAAMRALAPDPQDFS